MSTNTEIKLKRFLDLHVPGMVMLASWLEENGFSYDLQQRYRKSGWLESVGVGAFKRPNEQIDWQASVYSLQKQAKLPVVIGGLSALSILGASHYLRTQEQVFLYSPAKTKLPAWFKKYGWDVPIRHVRTSFLPFETGITRYDEKRFSFDISSAERAIFECL